MEDEILDRSTEKRLVDLVAALDDFSNEAFFPSGLNIFEAAGLERQELKHSNFLAFLLRPRELHGLRDEFLRRVLQSAVQNTADPPIKELEFALADLSDA